MIDAQTGPHQGPRKALTGNQEPRVRATGPAEANQEPQRAICSYQLSGGRSIHPSPGGPGRRTPCWDASVGAGSAGRRLRGCSWYQSQREPEAGTWINPPAAAAPLILPAKPPLRPPSPARAKPLQESGTRPEFIQLFLNSSLIFPGNLFC